MIDSDRDEPNGHASSTAQKICKDCTLRGIPGRMLARRESENYVPEAVWTIVLFGSIASSRSRKRSSGQNERAALVYRWLARTLAESTPRLSAKYGRDAVEQVADALARKSARKLSAPTVRELFDEWCALSLEEKAVDDLKVRFGDRQAQRAIEHMGCTSFDAAWLDQEAGVELGELMNAVEEWL